MTGAGEAQPLVEVVRSGVREGVHFGHAVIVDASGSVERSWGDPWAPVLPRSANKPFQCIATLEAGLLLPDELLALSAASHAGEEFHLAGVRAILSTVDLGEDDLQTPPDLPLDPAERDAWIRAGRAPARIAMNCSGKHAAMLAACVRNDWPTATYLDPDHPLQASVAGVVEDRTGERISSIGVDGCGAPLLGVSLVGLARGFSGLVVRPPGSPDAAVAAAMRRHPEQVGGSRLAVTAFMRAVPGLLAKNGAEGVYAGALPDGRAAALKVADGAERAQVVGFAGLLTAMGVDPDALGPLLSMSLYGGGRVVGTVRPLL